MQQISKYFAKAHLPIDISNRPIVNVRGTNSDAIFQMTIDSGKKERFRIFKGHGNDVCVLDCDQKKEQVLLFVKEPKRKFTEIRWDNEKGRNVEIQRETPDSIRHYLVGMDERHLFISELPARHGKINTIVDAHRILKPHEVKDGKKRKDAKIARQGEWFFIEATLNESEQIKYHLKSYGKIDVTQKNAPIGGRNRPHLAEKLLHFDDMTFVKGKIRHVDHKTLEFFTWHRVFRNTENVRNGDRHVQNWVD